MKTATVIFRTTPEKKATLKKEWEVSLAAARAAYDKKRIWGSREWKVFNEHPASLASWIETCAVEGSCLRALHAAPAAPVLQRRRQGRKGSHE